MDECERKPYKQVKGDRIKASKVESKEEARYEIYTDLIKNKTDKKTSKLSY